MSRERVPTVADMRKEIECDQCETSNPSKRCSRCHCVYYCSVLCQKLHWRTHKVDCVPVENMDYEPDRGIGMTSIAIDGTNPPPSAGCSICLSETAEHPVVLPDCGHVFCFTCLQQWQSCGRNSLVDREEPRGACPYCRGAIPANVADAALEKAMLYSAAGRLTDKVYDHHLKNANRCRVNQGTENAVYHVMDERQAKFCKLAEEQVNQVLLCQPNHTIAFCIKGQMLRFVKPHDAIDALHNALLLDAEQVTRKERLVQRQAEMNAYLNQPDRQQIDYQKFAQIVDEQEKLLLEHSENGQIGEGPYRLYRIRLWLAEAYESANKNDEAATMYDLIMLEMFSQNYNDITKMDPRINRMIIEGGSRCFFHQKDFRRGKKLAQMALRTNRHLPGTHILLAQSEWALGEKKEAIRTMCRGVLYELPGDEVNRERNRVYLQEFVDAMSG